MKLKNIITLFLLSSISLFAADFEFNGMIEQAYSSRYSDTDYSDDSFILAETQGRLEVLAIESDEVEFTGKFEILNDQIAEETDINIREAYVWIMPSDILEVKAGRQVITWGTGDLMFINDIFPKDYKAFFYGNNQTDMKLASDAIKFSLFPEDYIVDLVLIPTFESNNYIDGERFTYFNTLNSSYIPSGSVMPVESPDKTFNNMETALRVKKSLDNAELAFYGYKGFYKNPNANSNYTGLEFSKMSLIGASMETSIFSGIFNIEMGYENSIDDEDGDNSLINNSFFKTLIGFRKEIIANLNLGVQLQIDHMLNYDSYKDSVGSDYDYLENEDRTLLAIRLTQLLKQQTVKADLFTYYSPSDADGYINPNVDYNWRDGLTLSGGANIFYGKDDHTFFAQLKDNSNIYTRLRYSF